MNEWNLTEEKLAAFEQSLQQEEKSAATVDKYTRDAQRFAAWCDGREMNKELVIAYKQKLVDDGYKPRSINSMLASVNSLLSFLGLAQLRVRALKLQCRLYCPESRELTRAEYARLCTAAKKNREDRLLCILETICSTGIRVSELKDITVEAVNCGEATVTCKGKTRPVFLTKALQQRLKHYIRRNKLSSGPVFRNAAGQPVNRSCVWREMKALCADAGVNPEKVFPHNLRHLFARAFYTLEKDLAKLADILGHSSIETTRIYIISTGREHRSRMEQMHLVI